MKKLLLALAALALGAHLSAAGYNSNTNFGTIGVGSITSGSYTILSGVTEVYLPIPLPSFLTGANGTTAITDAALPAGLYISTAHSNTNTPAVYFPALLDTPTASVSVPGGIPWNYKSGGKLVIEVQSSISFTAGSLSITADAYQYAANAASITTKSNGTAVQVPQGAAAWGVTMTVTNLNLTSTARAGDNVVFKLAATRTAANAHIEIPRAWFVYRPTGVLNGQQ